MAKAASPIAAGSPTAAGVKTAATGVYSDPVQVGAMIQKMYPGYYDNFDPSVIGQRWIDMHTAQGSGSGTGVGSTGLSGPVGTTPLTSTDPNQNAPDLSGLSKFAKPITPPKPPAPRIIISGLSGNSPMGSQLTPMTTPVQQPQPQQKPMPSSTFDISKVNFGG